MTPSFINLREGGGSLAVLKIKKKSRGEMIIDVVTG
jgi:hypothetical protein